VKRHRNVNETLASVVCDWLTSETPLLLPLGLLTGWHPPTPSCSPPDLNDLPVGRGLALPEDLDSGTCGSGYCCSSRTCCCRSTSSRTSCRYSVRRRRAYRRRRAALRRPAGGADALEHHWPGTPEGLQVVRRLAGLRAIDAPTRTPKQRVNSAGRKESPRRVAARPCRVDGENEREPRRSERPTSARDGGGGALFMEAAGPPGRAPRTRLAACQCVQSGSGRRRPLGVCCGVQRLSSMPRGR
jgi:hypothetical protein